MNVLDYDVCAFSVDGQYMAAALSNRFIIKKHPFAGLHNTVAAAHAIDCLQWNVASDLVLCTQLEKGVIQVYDMCSKNWKCTLTSGYFKFIAAQWIAREKILLTLEFHVALGIFDIFTNSIVYIEVPKPIWPCILFDNDGTHMFVVSKLNGYEKLLMLHSKKLDRIIYIQDIIGTCDGLNKSPDNRFLCVFNKQKLAILNFLSGNVIGSVEYLYLNTMSWAPNSKYLALGCSLGNIVVLTSSNEFNVKIKLCRCSVNKDYNFFVECNKVLIRAKPSENFINNVPTKIASIVWSFDSSYFSSYEINSSFLCIWKNFKLICAVEFSSTIKYMQWCQSENKLSVVFGTELIFFWSSEHIPKFLKTPKFVDGTCLLVTSISWSFNNRDMILTDGKKCLLFTI